MVSGPGSVPLGRWHSPDGHARSGRCGRSGEAREAVVIWRYAFGPTTYATSQEPNEPGTQRSTGYGLRARIRHSRHTGDTIGHRRFFHPLMSKYSARRCDRNRAPVPSQPISVTCREIDQPASQFLSRLTKLAYFFFAACGGGRRHTYGYTVKIWSDHVALPLRGAPQPWDW